MKRSLRSWTGPTRAIATLALVGLVSVGCSSAGQIGASTGLAGAQPLRIGIIGSGNMGGGLGAAWAEVGHQIFFSSRNPSELAELVERTGPNSQGGTPEEAAAFGDVVLIAVPYGALPQVANDYGHLMRGKVVIDLGNPRADRDGPMADVAIEKGTGIATAEYLPGARVVRAFNAIGYPMIDDPTNDAGEKIGIPIAGDDPEAVATATRLAEEIGFDAVYVGGLDSARRFDRGTPVYVRGMTAAELRAVLDLPNPR